MESEIVSDMTEKVNTVSSKSKVAKVSVSATCFYCGNTLPVDEHGIPTSSVYRGEIHAWFCPDCKFKALDMSLAVGNKKKEKQ